MGAFMTFFGKRVRRRGVLLFLALGTLASLLTLVFNMAIDKDVSLWAKGLLCLFAFMVLIATALTGNVPFDRQQPLQGLRQPSVVASLFLAVLASFSAVSDMANLFSPRQAVETVPGTMQKTGEKVSVLAQRANDKLDKLVPDEAAARRIAGRWGETEKCDVVYRIVLSSGAFEIDREASGAPPFHLVARILGERPNGVSLAVVSDGPARGQALDLDLLQAGPVEILTWNEAGTDVPLQLHRCGGIA